MHYRLRTLLIVLALGPPVLAGAWWNWLRFDELNRKREAQRQADADFNQILSAKPNPTVSSIGNPFLLDMRIQRKTAE